MTRLATLTALSLLGPIRLLCPAAVHAQYPFYTGVRPACTAPAPQYFAGASYSFYTTPSTMLSYYPPGPYYHSSNYTPVYVYPGYYPARYYNPGPYYYTPAQSYTPGYYSYYYTPGYFRY
jgi:hypothetical protein